MDIIQVETPKKDLIAEAIFVCEFHDQVGNAIVYCYPEYG